jgi:hypothetical protein
MQPGNTGKSDWETEQEKRDWREADVPPPPPAGSGEMLAFFVSSASDYRFFIDSASLAPGADGVVRYTLVVRSPLGAESVTYEGIRCATREVKTYAYGGPDRSWLVRPGAWRRIEERSVQRWHYTLWREYFCLGEVPIRKAAEGVNALKRGGHPDRVGVPDRGY